VRFTSLSYTLDEVPSWRRIRRYAVPGWMIEQATQRRLAGDWQGACAAANVDVRFSLTDVAAQYGTAVVAALADDLDHFAPDLVRWHLPRYRRGRTTLSPGTSVTLASYGDQPAEGPYLGVCTPKMIDGPQRLTLLFGWPGPGGLQSPSSAENWATARHLWDARHAGELRERCGGSAERAPFCTADGTARSAAVLPRANPGPGDLAAHSEWVTMLQDYGEVERAFAAAGIALDTTPPERPAMFRSYPEFPVPQPLKILATYPLALTRLEPEIRLLAAAGFGGRFVLPHHARNNEFADIWFELDTATGLSQPDSARGGLSVRFAEFDVKARHRAVLPEACWRRLPDLGLLRHGGISPEGLHPLVSASLLPGRTAASGPGGPPDPGLPAPVRIRCRGEWHEARSGGGQLQVPHSAEEERRERSMGALGGPVAGCFAVRQAWTSGTGRLPRALRAQREEFFQLVQHGDTPGVLRLLDTGLDPRVRDGRQRTLLHLVSLVDYEAVLPRLLAAGLDLEALDHHKCTPLLSAVIMGPVGLVRALLGAGARTDVADHVGLGLNSVIVHKGRKDLRFLKNAVERDYPGLKRQYTEPGWDEAGDE
jgi:hypothetical protein